MVTHQIKTPHFAHCDDVNQYQKRCDGGKKISDIGIEFTSIDSDTTFQEKERTRKREGGKRLNAA